MIERGESLGEFHPKPREPSQISGESGLFGPVEPHGIADEQSPLQGDLFADFPALRFIIPHGGGAVPYHWGRYRGLADMLKRPALDVHLMNNVSFDTCVHHQPGVDLLADVIDTKNIPFGSEMVGAVRGIDPETGHHFDDTKRHVDALSISDEDRAAIYAGATRRVFPRLDQKLKEKIR